MRLSLSDEYEDPQKNFTAFFWDCHRCCGLFGSLPKVYRPYIQIPNEDIEFLNHVSAKSEILKRFNRVGEELVAGDRFEMTGWYPLPQRTVTGSAFAVVRRNGWKIYLFFNPEGALEEYFITYS